MIDERKQTIRQEIIDKLENNALTVRDISQSIGILEKDVYHHLTFIDKTVKHQKKRIHLEPYYCMNCGFQFKNRKTLKNLAASCEALQLPAENDHIRNGNDGNVS